MSLFRKDAPPAGFAEEKCRWCEDKIGDVAHWPVPVCEVCFQIALKKNTPAKGNLWDNLMTEFRSEARKWVKRISNYTGKTEIMTQTLEANGDVLKLRQRAAHARTYGNVTLALKFEKEASERQAAVTRFRSETPALISALDRDTED